MAFDFARRDFKERYVGTGLGQLWFLLSPIVAIFIYTVIFSDFMKMKMNLVDNGYAYSIYLVPGLLAWTSFSTILGRLNVSILEKANLIKKINVPMYAFQLSIAITEFALFILAFALGIGFVLIIGHSVTWSFLWLLPVMALQTLFVFSLGVILSLFTPFFKDLKEALPVIIQLWFWASPIIYLPEMIANTFPWILEYNPFYHFVHCYQDIFLYAKAPGIKDLAFLSLLSGITFVMAVWLYKKMIDAVKDII